MPSSLQLLSPNINLQLSPPSLHMQTPPKKPSIKTPQKKHTPQPTPAQKNERQNRKLLYTTTNTQISTNSKTTELTQKTCKWVIFYRLRKSMGL
jgi:hypothetical protein